MSRVTRITAVFSAHTATLWVASIAQAALIGPQLPYDKFGKLENDGPRCMATSTVNSFQYLENMFPKIYGSHNLLPGAGDGTPNDLESARNALDGGWTHDGKTRDGMSGSGLTFRSIWESKVFWVEDFAPNTTVLDGMLYLPGTDLSKWHRGSVLKNAFPTWGFLWEQIRKREDVEIGFDGGGISHAVTLTSIKFDDSNGNKTFDVGEKRFIDYLDPNNPSLPDPILAEITPNADGSLRFDWDNGKNPKVTNVRIYGAFSESAVPEPSTFAVWFLLGTLGITVGWWRRRRRTS